jgi:hypothetical protein
MTTLTTSINISPTSGESATPPSQTVTTSETTLVYELDTPSAKLYAITGLGSTDTKGQLSNVTIDPNGHFASVLNANTKSEQFSIFIYYVARGTTEKKRFDPEVINVPE